MATAPGLAGPLDPPAGPVAATNRTQILSAPYVISSPGSYVLARELVMDNGMPPGVAVTINASRVTLDLNGFTIRTGRIQSSPAITLASGISSVVIRNGKISGFGGQWTGGIIGADARKCRVEDLIIEQYAGGTVADRVGVKLGRGAVVTRCDVSESDGRGLELGDDSLVTDCTMFNHSNGSISTGQRSIVRGCTCSFSGGPGSSTSISAGAGVLIEDCSFGPANFQPGTAVLAGDSSTIRRCSVTGGSVNTPIKFIAGANAVIADCSLQESSITVGIGSRVQNCTVGSAQQNYSLVVASSRCSVTGCTLSGGLEGINATGPGIYIDGNTIGGAATGIALMGTGSRVTRNALNGCTAAIGNAAGNDVAPSGTAAATTNPWANLVN
jgi:hypothetical protein